MIGSRRQSVPGARAGGALGLAAVSLLVLAACASSGPDARLEQSFAQSPLLAPAAAHPGGGALWEITRRCLAAAATGGAPSPCAEVDAPPLSDGYVLFKDRVGATQYLLIPTVRITGIEDPAVLSPGAAPLFAEAWRARRWVRQALGAPVGDDELSVAVNSAYGRSQDQLHFHLDCVRSEVRAKLRPLRARLSAIAWTREPVTLAGAPYYARQIEEGALEGANLFGLAQAGLPGARQDMAAWSLAIVGGAGSSRLFILATRADPPRGLKGSAEALQDHLCARSSPDIGPAPPARGG